MKNKTIHIIGAGGPAGVGMTRCLKDAFIVTGEDDSQWGRLMMEAVAPGKSTPSLVLPIPDTSVLALALFGSLNTFLPDRIQLEFCKDKAKTAELLGELAPKTYWLRDTEGAGGKGAQMLTNYLPGKNYSVEFVFLEGQKLAHFQKERISYAVSHKTDGLENRGSSAVSICTNRDDVTNIALEALSKLATHTGTKLHGFYGVDIKCDENGSPKVTEINAGRLLTASYCYYDLTGYNLPLIGVKAFLNEPYENHFEYPEGWGIIRQIGQEPRLFDPSITKNWS